MLFHLPIHYLTLHILLFLHKPLPFPVPQCTLFWKGSAKTKLIFSKQCTDHSVNWCLLFLPPCASVPLFHCPFYLLRKYPPLSKSHSFKANPKNPLIPSPSPQLEVIILFLLWIFSTSFYFLFRLKLFCAVSPSVVGSPFPKTFNLPIILFQPHNMLGRTGQYNYANSTETT